MSFLYSRSPVIDSTNCGSCSTVGHVVLWYIPFEKKIRVKVDLWISNLCCSRVNCIHMPSNTYLQINNSLAWQPTPVLLRGKSHGWRSLVGCSPWGHGESDTTERLHFHFSLFAFVHWRRKWQPTPVFLPGESQGQGSLVGCRLWDCTESDTTEAT